LCEEVGAESWYNLPGALDPPEIAQFMEYIAGPSNVGMGKIRAALGHPEPWAKTLRAIHVELGNEIWNSFGYWWCGYKGPDYWSNLFALVKTSPYYTNNIICHSAGQNFSSGMADQVIRDAPTCDRYSIAPYVLSTLNTNDLILNNTDDKFYRWLFAYPLHSTYINGLPQQYVVMTNRHTEYSVYEFNHHTTSGSAGFTDVNNFVASAGAGVSIVNTMLAMLKQYGMRSQCLFTFTQNSYNARELDTSGNVWLWGTVRSTKPGSERYRPTGLGHMIANRVIGGNLTATTHTGDDPSFDGTGYFRGEESSVKTYSFKKLHSYAFREGSRRALIVVNFDVWSNQAVTIKLPQGEAPVGFAVSSWFLAASHVSNNNEFAENVAIVATNYANCTNYFTIAVPPHTIQAFTWQTTNVMAVITDVDALDVPENGTNVFRIKLAKQPAEGVTVTVTVSRVTQANANISVQSGSPRYFTSANWSTYQPVTLAAQDDAGYVAGSALFRCAAPGADHAEVTANEVENDANTPPATPGNVSPSDGATGQSVTPTLQSSAFSDSDPGDTHAASQWQVSTDSGFGTLVWDSGADTMHLTSAAPPALGYNARYYWHVRHRDSGGVWSEYSAATWFETAVDPNAPYAPANQVPVNGAGGVGLTPTLFASAFSDPNAGNTHAASQWQVSTGSNFVALVWDSGQDALHLTNVATPYLPYETRCYWRVRYKDNTGLWGAYSNPTWFDTLTRPHVYVWTNSAGGYWTVPGNWSPYGYPNQPGDTAILTNCGPMAPSSQLTINLLSASMVTVGVLRAVNFPSNEFNLTGCGLLMDNGTNVPVIEALNSADYEGLRLPATVTLTSELVVSNQGANVWTVGADKWHGSSTIRKWGGGALFAGGSNANYHGELIVHQGTLATRKLGGVALFDNAALRFKSGAQFQLCDSMTVCADVVAEDGATVYAAAYDNDSNTFAGEVTITGNVTWSTIWSRPIGTWIRGGFGGAGIVTFAHSNGVLTNWFAGSISPAGSLMLRRTTAMIYLGVAGDPLELRVGNGDVLSISNLPAAVDLSTIDLAVLDAPPAGGTNWFLSATDGITNTFNAVDFGGQQGVVLYDYAGGRAGVCPGAVAPAITQEPQSQTKNDGQSATFTVEASGTAPLEYHWEKEGSGAIGGATAAEYTIGSVQQSDEGGYRAIVSNVCGAATSSWAELTVNVAPAFTADPITGPAAAEGQAYSGSIAGDAGDADAGDTLSFSKQGGPLWLSVAADGALSGTPGPGDLGLNQFTVRVTDQGGLYDDAALDITVNLAWDGKTFVYTNCVSGGSWTNELNWMPNGVPNAPSHIAVLTNYGPMAPGSQFTINLPAASMLTVGVVRAVNFPSNELYLSGCGFVMDNGTNAPVIEVANSADYEGLRIPNTLLFAQTLFVSNQSANIWTVGKDIVSTGTIDKWGSGGVFIGGSSSNFSGVLVAHQGSLVTRSNMGRAVLSNATIRIASGAQFHLRDSMTVYADVVAEDGATVYGAAFDNDSNTFAGEVTITGNVTWSTIWSRPIGTWIRGGFVGAGIVTFTHSNGVLTNWFQGSISPAGSLMLRRTTAMILLGSAGDPVELRVGNGDVLSVSNAVSALDLSTIDVAVLDAPPAGDTNWFLTSTSGITGAFHAVDFGGNAGVLIYDYAGNRAGVGAAMSTNALILSAKMVDVPEGSTAAFDVKLTYPPSGVLTVSTARIAGDTDLCVSSGAALVFNSGNYSSWQSVTLGADEDGDVDNGGATFR
ncbi:hypothetical protein GX586_02660, partial [bacterium]|nr:hypothetical protein [bacterium]